jgi:hypothetical protein
MHILDGSQFEQAVMSNLQRPLHLFSGATSGRKEAKRHAAAIDPATILVRADASLGAAAL